MTPADPTSMLAEASAVEVLRQHGLSSRNNGDPHWAADPDMTQWDKIEIALDRWEEIAIFRSVMKSRLTREAYLNAYCLLIALIQNEDAGRVERLAEIEQASFDKLAAALHSSSASEIVELREELDGAKSDASLTGAGANFFLEKCREAEARATAAEAERDALQARVRTLEEVLQPFVAYAEAALWDGMEGEIGEVYKDGFRRSIHTRDLRRARAALTRQDGRREDGDGRQ